METGTMKCIKCNRGSPSKRSIYGVCDGCWAEMTDLHKYRVVELLTTLCKKGGYWILS